MAARLQAKGILRLDPVDSDGKHGRTLFKSERLMARAHDGSSWYGFIIIEMHTDTLEAGSEAQVGIAFLDDEGAKNAFPVNKPFLFGSGVKTRGSITLDRYFL